jgi:hypothetical protein
MLQSLILVQQTNVNSLRAMSDVENKKHHAYGTADRSLVEHVDDLTRDCLGCRIVGSGTFAAVGSYALWQARAAAPGSPGQKRIIAGLGVGAFHSVRQRDSQFTFVIQLYSREASSAGTNVRQVFRLPTNS